MMSSFKSFVVVSVLIIVLCPACKKQTDEHNTTGNSVKNNLFEKINAEADLSTFASYLKQTGYDKEIASSKTYTVFALPNAVLATLDASIVNNPDKLKLFIGNHIATQLYYTPSVTVTTRIPMVNGKYNNMKGNKIGEATITGADKYAANGVYHILDKTLPALDNCWEFLTNNPLAPTAQKALMLSLFRNVFDTTNAIVIGIDPNTGEPIYQQGTDSVYTNLFWNRVHDLRNESKQFTLFMLTDAAWNTEVDKYKPFFVTGTADSTTLVSGWNVVKDFAVDTLYDPASIPDTVLSKFGTKVPVASADIVQTIKTSNGIVYILSKSDVQPSSKFKPYLIQGEQYNSTSHDRRSNTYFRDRYNSLTGKDFRDVLVQNHGVSQFNIRYEITEVPTIKYKAYWVALNDFQTATFQQRLAIGTPTATTFGYLTVNINDYNEIYLGEFTMAKYEPVYNVYLVGANSTTAAANPLVCDYIKLVPSL